MESKIEINWEGFFTYEFDDNKNEKIPFELFLEFDKNSFTGYSVDEETKNLFKKGDVKVKGFIDELMISFIIIYPFSYYVDEEEKMQIDYSIKNHSIEYIGNWNKKEQKYEGKYEVIFNDFPMRYDGSYDIEYYTGNWEMIKK